jgi:cytochrome c peroxidase
MTGNLRRLQLQLERRMVMSRQVHPWLAGFFVLGVAFCLGLAGCQPPDKGGDESTEVAAPDDDGAEAAPAEEQSTPPAAEEMTAEPAEEAPAEPAAEEAPGDTAAEEAPAEPAAEEASTAPEMTAPANEAAPAAEEPAAEPAEEAAPAEPAAEEAAFEVKVPLGLPPLPVPEDNPMTAAKVELGKLLYFDKRLSKDASISCATCHDPEKGWAEHTPTSTGFQNQVGDRNSPTVLNSAYAKSMFWDGRAASLEEQALGPMANPIEMAHTLDDIEKQLNEIPAYKEHFQKVFGTDVTRDGMAKAIAAFERTILSGNSAFDKFKAGDEGALTDVQKKGMDLFDENCAMCHSPPLFSNYMFINAGVGMDAEEPDKGRMNATEKENDLGKFRVPSLRDVANTAPYFHDGSAATLEEAVALMAAGGKDNPKLSPLMKAVGEAKLSAEDQAAIVEFLKALSGEPVKVEIPEPL